MEYRTIWKTIHQFGDLLPIPWRFRNCTRDLQTWVGFGATGKGSPYKTGVAIAISRGPPGDLLCPRLSF